MNEELITYDNTISSMEVAEMLERAHGHVLRSIRMYSEQFNQSKIASVDFWTETSYIDSKGESRSCYNVTKKGCEFLAHKTTGQKGTVFTARYINRFHEMEECIREQSMSLCTHNSLALAKNTRTWYDTQKWKMEKLCADNGWERKYLYHKILREITDVFSLDFFKESFYDKYHYEAKYDMEIVNEFPELQEVATKYLDFLLDIMDYI